MSDFDIFSVASDGAHGVGAPSSELVTTHRPSLVDEHVKRAVDGTLVRTRAKTAQTNQLYTSLIWIGVLVGIVAVWCAVHYHIHRQNTAPKIPSPDANPTQPLSNNPPKNARRSDQHEPHSAISGFVLFWKPPLKLRRKSHHGNKCKDDHHI